MSRIASWMSSPAKIDSNRLLAFVAGIKHAPLTQAEEAGISAILAGAPRKLAWGAKVSPTFRERVRWIAQDLRIGVSADDGADNLMACIAWESGRTFSPKVVNQAGSGAVGLIQCMPATALSLGTTTAQLAKLSAEDQLNFVWKYFAPYKGRLRSLADTYMAILWPAAIGVSETAPLWTRSGRPTTYRQNSGLDANSDGSITKREAAGKVRAILAEGLRPENAA